MRNRTLLIGLAVCAILAGCEKPVHPNDLPVSHWLNDENACIRKTAQSIIQSGRPWPNEVIDTRPNQLGQYPLIRYDLWVADQLYELPGKGKFLKRNGFDARHSPWKYTSVSGNLEDVLGIPQQKFKDHKVGGTLFGNLICQIEELPSRWIENRADHAPTRAALIQKLIDQVDANKRGAKVKKRLIRCRARFSDTGNTLFTLETFWRKLMAFEIRLIDRPTFDAIWTPKVKNQLNDIIYSVENWIDEVGDMHWVIDDATGTCCLPVSMANKFDAARCYALVKDGEFALIRKVKFGTYSIAATSAGFSQRIDEVKQLATEALLLGGSLMSGNPDPRYNEDTTKISSVDFVEYIAPKIGE